MAAKLAHVLASSTSEANKRCILGGDAFFRRKESIIFEVATLILSSSFFFLDSHESVSNLNTHSLFGNLLLIFLLCFSIRKPNQNKKL